MKCNPVAQFPGVTNLLELFAVLEQCWSRDTAYPACQEEWVAILPYFLILVAVIYPLNKVLDTNFFFLNYPPEGTPFVVFEELLGNPGFIIAFAALLVTVWTLLYLPWRKKGEKVVQKAA